MQETSAGDRPFKATSPTRELPRRGAIAATKVLIIDSDAHWVDLLTWLFDREGFEIEIASTGAEGILLAQDSPPDLVLVDFNLPDLPGIDVIKRLRRNGPTFSVPIAMVAAGAHETDRANALDSGVDDFIAKPLGAREIVARVYALLRRAQKGLPGDKLSYAGIEMDVSNYKVKRDKLPISLSPVQFRLLRHFMEHPGQVFSRKELLASVWGPEAKVDERTVDAQLRHLRRALNDNRRPDLFRTVRAEGYALDAGD